jgi:hypothetical protein
VDGARFDVETAAPPVLACPCGFEGELGPGDVVGHMTVCPACGAVSGVAAAGADVELVAVHLHD